MTTESIAQLTAADIRELIYGFESGTLPKEKWTHEAHLLMALWYLWSYSSDEAIPRICEGIQKYNIASGGQNTDTSGYHETLTLFWISVVAKFLEKHILETSIEALANQLVEEKYPTSLPLNYYSREQVFSVQARKEWVEPDIKPLSE
ncbi:hypothetical protein QNI19_17120 [Cytophagaceae bacterium DM2B3-1]|uniref:Uncharacterized protein n=1 Tax=Xanthocytophaga flava TaxID=3048013 RepID=A0ABT7CLR3_9BACT|nr:hypothetical protein [Xanthocytophaga flavus]MDJ1494671.1 hypothetical protein [Xanthocytophaga flavus]